MINEGKNKFKVVVNKEIDVSWYIKIFMLIN